MSGPRYRERSVARLPWGHITILLGKLDARAERDWYAERAAENGWTRNVLERHIKVNLRTALCAAPTNFTAALDSPDSELAQQLVKDPYVFEHLGLLERKAERDPWSAPPRRRSAARSCGHPAPTAQATRATPLLSLSERLKGLLARELDTR